MLFQHGLHSSTVDIGAIGFFGQPLNYRLVYRKLGGVDRLLVSHAVDPDGSGAVVSTVRWYEIRNPLTATPYIFQTGIVPFNDGAARWMPSVAMNGRGDILVGYSISSTTIYPSIAVAGSLYCETEGKMSTEMISMEGSGYNPLNSRWGDYWSMVVDPSDDRTCWFSAQYLAAGHFYWHTRIQSFTIAPGSAGSCLQEYCRNPGGTKRNRMFNINK